VSDAKIRTDGVPVALSKLVRRITCPNPGMMTGPGTNTYLVGQEEIAVIDPGPDQPEHLDAIAACGGDRIRWIVTTHTHPDHSPGAEPLRQRLRPDVLVLGFAERDGFVPDATIGDGHVIDAREFELRAVHTPGHAANHLCYLLESERLLFSGDHIMNGSTVVIRPPDGDMAVYLEQLERLRDVRMRNIAPGHGAVIDDPQAKVGEYVAHRLTREAKVLEHLRSARSATVKELVPTVYDDVPTEKHWIAESSLWAHLRKLADDGLADASDRDADDATWTAT
jgi:glyoxylase-like metal-dependent hydrolase (beta-lactamase superfamily II)